MLVESSVAESQKEEMVRPGKDQKKEIEEATKITQINLKCSIQPGRASPKRDYLGHKATVEKAAYAQPINERKPSYMNPTVTAKARKDAI